MMIVTNNPLVRAQMPSNDLQLIWVEGEYEEVLRSVRNRIHLGHQLLTHPLAGSVKPYETPYRTVLLSAEPNSLHLPSLSILEQALTLLASFKGKDGGLGSLRTCREEHLPDLQLVDYSLMEAAINQQPTMQETLRNQERGETV
ncbi:MAG: GrdX family protein [Bacillota bacterium]|nr:GrdX family protein [Bacillota bacterium]MDW7676143.1 GrdX family protein [Bacillota bacterium]